jgi:predicted NAD/FAD-binding protein
MITNRIKRVLVVGSGAAGTAAAWSLSHEGRFAVEVWEAAPQAGGVATSEVIAVGSSNGVWLNDGVQGGSPTYRNTLWLHEQVGIAPRPIDFRVSFGRDDTAWNNTTTTKLVERLSSDIERFGRLLAWIDRMEPLSALLPIGLVLKAGGFSRDFRDHMLFPLVALFFGTGNQTRRVSAAIIARVFSDEKLRLFDFDPERLLSQRPAMFAFDRLSDIYASLVEAVEKTGRAKFHFARPVSRIERAAEGIVATDEHGATERFDELIFACPADVALRALVHPTFRERQVLGAVQYFHDITVTHTDRAYMERYYELDDARGDQYFIRAYPDATDRIEMSFDLSHYQPQLEASVYQTIFLDRDHDEHRWTIDEIDPSRVLFSKPWIQFSHTWQHYVRVVPWLRFLQGRRHTHYAGSWTLANTHEVATISGFAAAYRLGARYPLANDVLAREQFQTYLSVVHGVRANLAALADVSGS